MTTKITFSTSGGGAVDAVQERIAKRQKQTTQEIQLTNREVQNMGRIQQQVLRAVEAPLEKYNRQLRETKIALAGHARETELVARRTTQLKLEYAKTSDAQKSLNKVVGESKTRFGALGDAIASAVSPARIAAFAGGFVGVHQAVRLITDELQAQQEIIDKRVEAQLTVGQSRNVLLRNLVGQEKKIPGVQSAAASIAAQTGLSEVPINLGLASAVSSTGGNVDLSVELVRLAAKFLKDRPQEIGGYAGTLADLTRVTRSVDPKVQLGLLAKVGQLSRVVSPELQAKNIAPALIGTVPFGGTARTSGALFGALTGGSADVTGERTGTAVISLAAQLEDATQGTNTFRPSKTSPGPIRGLSGTTDLAERLDYLQSHPRDAKYFLEKGSFEKKVLGPITQLLTDPTAQVSRDYAAYLDQIPDNAGLAAVGDQALGVFKFNTLEPVAERNRRLSSGLEQLQTRQPEGRLSATELETLRGISLETGSTSLGAKFGQLSANVTGGIGVSTTEAIGLIEGRISRLEHPTNTESVPGSGVPIFRDVSREPTEGEKEQSKILREVVGELKKTNHTLSSAKGSGGILVGTD